MFGVRNKNCNTDIYQQDDYLIVDIPSAREWLATDTGAI